ncbi:MAG: aminopeptidase [Calditrichae bacterium]|nr:aminopeptidase [Calditrichota bacterium]MCB9056982.1 aminopeptidase [Calditrichia bacterium]
MESAFNQAVQSAYIDCLDLKKSESVLVITDDDTFEVGHALYVGGQKFASQAHLLLMPVAEVNGQEPPDPIAQAMTQYDVVLCPTAKSLTHTDAKRNACKQGVRVATLPGITKDVFIRTMKVDYNKVAERTWFISGLLEKTEKVYIKTDLGTDLILPISGMKPISSTGLIREKGKGGNIPSGESFLAPKEGETQGTLVVDASIAGIGLLDRPVTIKIKDGFAYAFSGSDKSKLLEKDLSRFGKPGFNVAELGIGTNDGATVTGKILEDEKVFGTIHIAFGNNITMGGTCNVGIHIDCVVQKPDVWFDDLKIMEKGKMLVKESIND